MGKPVPVGLDYRSATRLAVHRAVDDIFKAADRDGRFVEVSDEYGSTVVLPPGSRLAKHVKDGSRELKIRLGAHPAEGAE